MKRKLAILFICCFTAVQAFTQLIDLSGEWKFSKSDNPSYASAVYQDAAWAKIPAGKPWEAALNESYDGIAWYRKTVVIGSNAKKETMQYGFMLLYLGKIDDADECFFNGTKVGSTGAFPPQSITAWDKSRIYKIPMHLIQWNKPNTIAVRVSDWGGGGGLYSGDNYSMEAGNWKTAVTPGIQYENVTNNEIEKDNTLTTIFSLQNNNKIAITGKLYTGYRNFGNTTLLTDSTIITIKPKEMVRLKKEWSNIPPGFYHSFLLFKKTDASKLEDKLGFAVSPQLLKVLPDQQPDFETFWQTAKKELAAVAPQFTVIPKPELNRNGFEVSLVEMRSLGNARVRGWLMMPKGKTKPPALLHVPGYSSEMKPWGGDASFAHFYFNIRGHGNSKDDVNPGFPGYILTNLDDKNNYIYRGAFMDCIRAVDFLYQLNTIDTSRIGVEGGSQGGALTIITAAMDKRIKCAAPDVPFLSDYKNYFAIANWPGNEFKNYVEKNKAGWAAVYTTMSYFDIKNFTPMIHCPVLMGVGLFDDICPPAINFAAFNNIPVSDKKYYLYSKAAHSLPSEHFEVKMKWLKEKLKVQ